MDGVEREKRDGKMAGGEEKQRGDRQKKLTRLVIRGGKDGGKKKLGHRCRIFFAGVS